MKKLLMPALLATATLAFAQEAKLSPFGIGTCHAWGHSLDVVKAWAPEMRAIGLEWYRTPPSHQRNIEPKQGEWELEKLAAANDYMDEIGMNFGVLLWGHGWKGDKGFPKNDLESWAEYVRQMVALFVSKGKTGLYYEIWNEPPNFTAKGDTAADYGRLVAIAHDVAKAIDPTAKIGITAKSAHVNWLAHAIRHGAKDKFDWVSLHPYETLNGVVANAGSDPLFLGINENLRKMLRALNPERADVPLFFTEIGCDAGRHGEEAQADTLVKTYVMGIAQGVAQIQWFEVRDGDSGPMGVLRGDGTKRPAYTAYATMIKHFGQHPEYVGWTFLTEKRQDIGYVFKGADEKYLLAAWTSKKNQTTDIQFLTELEIVRPQTGEIEKARSVKLSNSPIFLLYQGFPGAAFNAAGNKRKPFPWDGDYTDAKEISITYATDGKVISKGLHTTDGEAILKAVQLYGDGHAQVGFRDGTTPGGNSFVCDPNFLSYKTGPIEITIVAQRKDPAQTAAIDLEYEYDNPADPSGIHPFKKIAREIPEGDDWHTLTWRLDDAEFNAYWGFHFRFPAGPFNIRGVTVKKL